MLLSLPLFPNDVQAWGTILPPPPCWWPDWSGICSIRRSRAGALSPPAGELKPDPTITPAAKGIIVMANAQLQPVLDRIDADFDNAWSGCSLCCGSSRSRPIPPLPATARRPPIILPRISRRSALRPRSGRPPAIPPSSPRPMAARGGRMCCSTVTTMCSRSTRSISGTVRRSSLSSPTMPTAARSSSRAAPRTTRVS